MSDIDAAGDLVGRPICQTRAGVAVLEVTAMGLYGKVLLCVWLILMGGVQALALSFQAMNVVLGVLAIVAGILILMGK